MPMKGSSAAVVVGAMSVRDVPVTVGYARTTSLLR